MSILQWLLQTDSGMVGLILRITLSVVMFPHGAQKVLGWFGGHGFKATMKSFTNSGIPRCLHCWQLLPNFWVLSASLSDF